MKKLIIMLFGLLLVSGVFAAGNETSFVLNFGTTTDDGLHFKPFWWTVGGELDFQIRNYLMFSPEVTLVGSGSNFKDFFFRPAVILNFTPGNFFVGGGLTKHFYIGHNTIYDTSDIALKLNAGLISRNIKLTAYLITYFDNLFKSAMWVGASLGFRF
jgi:hypothetical protein